MTQTISDVRLDELTPLFRRRPRRTANPVDTVAFRHHIEQAMEAFQTDVSYAVQMARAAVTITRKREVWQARRDARAAAPDRGGASM